MVNGDVEYWNKTGNEFYNTKNFEEAIKCYEKAAQLNPHDTVTFSNWGHSLIGLAEIKKDETLYWEAIEKYKKAVQINPDNAIAFSNWGIALVKLAAMKQDEALYREAFEKFDLAAKKKPDYAITFGWWGYALAELAGIKQDETLYREAAEKYKKAVQLDPNSATAFNNWGYALAELARIKQDKTLYLEAIEKYKKTVQIDVDYATAFNNWGNAIVGFSEITKDKGLIKPLFDEFYLESDSLKKLNKDILGICIIFNKKNIRDIIDDKELFFPLLDLQNDDGVFFRKITKDITDTEKLDKYKRAYILSVLIISQLHINNENEKSVAYYTKKTVSQEMLFNDAEFRLNAINYSNDPTEGEILLDYLFGEKKYSAKEFNTGYGAFAGCFTFNHDSLNQFRLYGKTDDREGTGLSLVFKDTFFSEKAKMAVKHDSISVEDKQHALFRCIYIDPETRRVETVGHKEAYLFYRGKNPGKIDDYNKYINGILENVGQEMEELKKLVGELKPEVIGPLLINLRYLTKHIAFKEEQECRIIKIHPLHDKETIKINSTSDPDKEDNTQIKIDKIKQLYIGYQNVTGHVEKIYFGPNATQMELFQDLLRYKGKDDIQCKRSKNPLS